MPTSTVFKGDRGEPTVHFENDANLQAQQKIRSWPDRRCAEFKEKSEICTAPPGEYVIVHFDARDRWPTRHGNPIPTIGGVRAALDLLLSSQLEEMAVFNDQGTMIPFKDILG